MEDFLRRHPELSTDPELTIDLIYSEVMLRRDLGEHPQVEEYTTRFPDHATPVQRQFEFLELLDRVREPDPTPPAATSNGVPPHPAPGTAAPPPRLPGYEILGQLGAGARGVVYQ